MRFAEELLEKKRKRFQQKVIEDSTLTKFKDFLAEKFVVDSEPNVSIMIASGGYVKCGLPDITNRGMETWTFHIAYKDSLKHFLDECGFEVKMDDNEPSRPHPAHGGFISNKLMREWVISLPE